MTDMTMPPVPNGLRDMLKDYPDHIERLQQALNWTIEHPSAATPPFEVAIWALEGRLETFISEARDELDAAEALGDAEAIARADRKLDLMFSCRSSVLFGCENLASHFDNRKHEGGHHGE